MTFAATFVEPFLAGFLAGFEAPAADLPVDTATRRALADDLIGAVRAAGLLVALEATFAVTLVITLALLTAGPRWVDRKNL